MLGCNISSKSFDLLDKYDFKCLQIFLADKDINKCPFDKQKTYIHSSFSTVMNERFGAAVFRKQYKLANGYRGIIIHLPAQNLISKQIFSSFFKGLPSYDNFTIYFEHVIGKYCDVSEFVLVLNHMTRLMKGINPALKVGAVIDTCHVYSAGYDVAEYYGFRDKFHGDVIVHLNDSQNSFDSKLDRHGILGENIFADKESVFEFIDNTKADDYIIELREEAVVKSLEFLNYNLKL